MSYHRITVIGYVGSVPEYRVTATDKDYAHFPLYVNERHGNAERSYRYKIKTWNELSLIVKDHLVKGQLVVVEGTPSVETWRDASGKPRAQLVVTAQTLRFLGAKPEADEFDEVELEEAET